MHFSSVPYPSNEIARSCIESYTMYSPSGNTKRCINCIPDCRKRSGSVLAPAVISRYEGGQDTREVLRVKFAPGKPQFSGTCIPNSAYMRARVILQSAVSEFAFLPTNARPVNFPSPRRYKCVLSISTHVCSMFVTMLVYHSQKPLYVILLFQKRYSPYLISDTILFTNI